MNNITKEKWLRQNTVDIFKYLPYFLQKDERFKSMNDSDSIEHEMVRNYIVDIFKQSFIDTATWGLDKWEELLAININENLDYQTRRANIISRLNGTQTMNLAFLMRLVNVFVADKTGLVIDKPEDYSLDILIPDGKVISFKDLETNLKIFVPAHIGWKYLAYVNLNSDIYVGSVMTSYFYTEIPADTSYNIAVDDTKCETIGVVKQAQILNIPANYTV